MEFLKVLSCGLSLVPKSLLEIITAYFRVRADEIWSSTRRLFELFAIDDCNHRHLLKLQAGSEISLFEPRKGRIAVKFTVYFKEGPM